MDRESLLERIEQIQNECYNKFKGSNEAELHCREEIADLFQEELLKQSNKIAIPTKLENITIIPSEPYLSEEISSSDGNLWELHELNGKQDVKISINND